MPADVWLIVEVLGLMAAAALAAWSIAKFDLRPMIAAAAIAGSAWLLAAFFNDQEPYERLGLLTLHLRLVDAATAEAVRGATVRLLAQDEAGKATAYPLPAAVVRPDGGGPEVLLVPLLVQRQIRGSLVEQFRNSTATNQIVDQNIEVVAPGYQPWRGTLRQLLPDGWPGAAVPRPIALKLRHR